MLRLRDLREDNELTQEACAKIAFISKNSYIRYEKEERVIPLDTLIYYAKYYNTSLDYLAGLTNSPKPYPKN
ncbi:transcriptional regulator [Clostridium sp. CAG:575]|nr:transcriptional regulator [Clostridium sp. CAG:575]